MLRAVFSFQGRLNRAKAWLTFAVLFASAVAMIALERLTIWIGDLVGSPPAVHITDIIVAALAIAYVLTAVPVVSSVLVRRLHDRNRSSLWLLPYVGIVFVCLLPLTSEIVRTVLADLTGLALSIEVLALPGTAGPNSYGSDPTAN